MVFYFAAVLIVAGVALYVAAPLAGGITSGAQADIKSGAEIAALRREHALAVQGLRELEFDREMGKLSDADYESLRSALENRALAAMSSLEKLSTPAAQPRVTGDRVAQLRRPSQAAAQTARGSVCPGCGVRAAAGSRFCGDCGAALEAERAGTGS